VRMARVMPSPPVFTSSRRSDRGGAEPDGININAGVGATHLSICGKPCSSTAPTWGSRSTATATG
jgi:hypothetical protein